MRGQRATSTEQLATLRTVRSTSRNPINNASETGRHTTTDVTDTHSGEAREFPETEVTLQPNTLG